MMYNDPAEPEDAEDSADAETAEDTAEPSTEADGDESDENKTPPINIRVSEVNMEEADEDSGPYEFWKSEGKPQLPYMVLIRPHPYGGGVPAWHGPLTEGSEEVIIDSPVRQEIAKRLAAGDVAVWVILESGNSKQDFEAEKKLRERLPENSNRLINYEIVRVSRKDPKEQVFVDLLMSCEEGLEEYVEKTMVFPVFGRGRALYALVGAGINNDNIDEACMHLAGACMCTDKNRALGADMLMRFDWDKAAYDLPELTVDDLAEAAREAYEAAQAENEEGEDGDSDETESSDSSEPSEPSEGDTGATDAPEDTSDVATTDESTDPPAETVTETVAPAQPPYADAATDTVDDTPADAEVATTDTPAEDAADTEDADAEVTATPAHTPSEEAAEIDNEESVPLVGLGTIAEYTSDQTLVARSPVSTEPTGPKASIWDRAATDVEQPEVEMLAMVDTDVSTATTPGITNRPKPDDSGVITVKDEQKETETVTVVPAAENKLPLNLILFGTLGVICAMAIVASVLMWTTGRNQD